MKKKKNIYTCTKYFISILPSQNISFPFHTKVTEIPVAVQHSHNPIIVSCNFRMLSITNSSLYILYEYSRTQRNSGKTVSYVPRLVKTNVWKYMKR